MRLSLKWAQENSNVDLLKIGKDKLLEKIGSQLGAIDEVVKRGDDTIIDIENKMFTHRPDCFGILGLARELAGIQDLAFKSPKWYLDQNPKFKIQSSRPLPLEIKNEIPALVPRFMAVAISNLKIAPSPTKIQNYLASVGIKPINNVVDITNYVMYLTGQPLHAFDYDKLAALDGAKTATLIARKAKKGEKLHMLNGKSYTLNANTMVLASAKHPADIAGIMGGKETEVGNSTKNIVLTCANFDMYAVRRASMHYGLFTDAVTRFNKGQSPHQTNRVLAKTIGMLAELAGGVVASKVFDISSSLEENKPIRLTADFINSRLGLKLSATQIKKLLTNVEFDVKLLTPNSELLVLAPFWRTDIQIPEDIVEEVGRLLGYDQLPLVLPKRLIKPTQRNELLEFKSTIRDILSDAGANEVLTYSFVHGQLLSNSGQDVEKAYKLSNAQSPELQYFRMSLTPSLLDKVHPNIKAGIEQFAIFEIGKGHDKDHTEKDLPKELELTGLTFAANDKMANKLAGAPYYAARAYLDVLGSRLGLELKYSPIPADTDYPITAPFDLKRSAFVTDVKSGTFLGLIGEYKAAVRRMLKLSAMAAGFELGTEDLRKAHQAAGNRYQPLPDYPEVSQDITLKVEVNTLFNEVNDLLQTEIAKLKEKSNWQLEPISIYQPAKDKKHKHMTFRLTIASYKRTLTAKEVNSLLEKVAAKANVKIRAIRI